MISIKLFKTILDKPRIYKTSIYNIFNIDIDINAQISESGLPIIPDLGLPKFYESDFSVDSDGWDGTVDSLGESALTAPFTIGLGDNCLRVVKNSGETRIAIGLVPVPFSTGNIRITGRIYIPSTNTYTTGISINHFSGSPYDTVPLIAPPFDEWVIFDTGVFSRLNTNVRIYGINNASSATFASGATSEIIYLRDLTIYDAS